MAVPITVLNWCVLLLILQYLRSSDGISLYKIWSDHAIILF